ncbi:MAG: WXG100 family type VII secretion target [Actinobacteria bacterium]|nr:WXG100 family type VII secretion target [Actinomycetota bacterium]
MSVFTVDTDAVATTRLSVGATAERLQADAAAMMAQLTQLQSSWTGAASVACQDATEQWRSAQMHVEQALAAIAQALGSAAQLYAQAESDSLSLFR